MVKKLLASLLLFTGLAFSQAWPGAVVTNSTIPFAVDHSTTTLSTTITSSSTTISVASSASFAAFQVINIDSEQIQICSVSTGILNVCGSGRGYFGTTAATHSSGANVFGYVNAGYHNTMFTEIASVENWLNTVGIMPSIFTSIFTPAFNSSFTPAFSSAVNNNSVFTQTGTGAVARTVASKEKDVISVKDFGAKGDGTTDDTAAIQAAINSVIVGTTGKSGVGVFQTTIEFPCGIYVITSTLVISQTVAGQRLTLRGCGFQGSNSTTIQESTNPNIDMINASTSIADGFNLEYLEFLGGAYGPVTSPGYPAAIIHGTGNGLNLGSSTATAYSSIIKNCWFSAIPHAAVYVQNAQDLRITDSAMENSDYGILALNMSNSRIIGTRFFSDRYAGIDIAPSGSYNSSDNDIIGNFFDYNGNSGPNDDTVAAIVLNNSGMEARNNNISSNGFRNNTNDFLIEGASNIGAHTGFNDVHIVANNSDFAIRHSILITSGSNISIVGNHIRDASNNGAALYAAIDIEGTSASNDILDNVVTLSAGGLNQTYGLLTGSSTTGTEIGTNNLNGVTGSMNILGTAVNLLSGPLLVAQEGSVTDAFRVQDGSGNSWLRVDAGITFPNQVQVNSNQNIAKLVVGGHTTGNALGALAVHDTTDTNRKLYIGYASDLNMGIIQATDAGVANEPITINANGGHILLGTSTDNGTNELQVNGSINGTAYYVGGTAGFNGSKTAGACTFTIMNGIITNVTGC